MGTKRRQKNQRLRSGEESRIRERNRDPHFNFEERNTGIDRNGLGGGGRKRKEKKDKS